MFNLKIFKIFAAVLIIGIFISGVNSVFAQTPGYSNAPHSLDTGGVPKFLAAESKAVSDTGGTLYGIASIAGNVLTFVSGLIDVAISFGNNVINLPVVSLGFQTVLGIANLGFVLAIIIIAFATIFRLESYAIKQTLWKLVIAALLVNFSLVIAGAFISFSNTFSNYFLEAFHNDSVGDALADIIEPQKLTQVAGADDPKWYEYIANPVSATSRFVTSLFFVTVFTLLIVLTFFALFVMLLIRSIYLSFLLIIMPLAWLAFIFPSTSQYWKKWWTQFIRWVFFAPIVLFFIYIVVTTGNNMGESDFLFGSNQTNSTAVSVNNEFALASADSSVNSNQENLVENNTNQSRGISLSQSPAIEVWEKSTNFPTGFFGYLAQLIIIIGLLMGGLIAANSLGITFANTAYGWAKGAGKGAGRWAGGGVGKLAGKAGLGVAGRTVGGEKMKGLAGKLAGSKVPGSGLIARGLNKLGAKTEQATQKQYEDDAKLYSGNRLQTAILASWGAKRAAFINKAAKDRDINKEVKEKHFGDAQSMGKIENEMSRAGYNSKEVAKTIGYNSEILKTPEGEERNEAFNKLYDGFSSADWSKLSPLALIDDKFGDVITENLLIRSTGSLSKILPKAKKKDDVEKITKQVNDVMKKVNSNPKILAETKKKIADAVTKHLASRITGGGPEEKEEKKEEEKK